MSRSFLSVFRGIPARMRTDLPSELLAFQWQATSWQAKAWYGNKDLHYELWVRHHLKVVELGLHFESDALTNARLYGAFRARSKQIARALGPDARIETWDKGWTRVWQPLAMATIDDAFSDRIQSRFVEYVGALEPILRDELPSEVEWRIAKPKRATAVRRPVRGSALRASRSAR